MTKIPRRYSWIWVTDANMCPPEHEAEVIANRRRRLIKAAEYNDTLLTQLGSKTPQFALRNILCTAPDSRAQTFSMLPAYRASGSGVDKTHFTSGKK